MLVEVLISIPLPVKKIVEVRVPWIEGLANFLLEGSWSLRQEIPDITPAGVLARLCGAVRQLDLEGRLLLGSGALEALDLVEQVEPHVDLGALPEGWQSGLSDGTLRFLGRTERLEFTLSGRLLTRVRAGEPALRLALRGAYRGLFPALADPAEAQIDASVGVKRPHPEGTEIRSTPQTSPQQMGPTYLSDLMFSLQQPDAFARLRRLLLAEGEAVVARLAEQIAPWTAGPVETWSRVLVLDHLDGLEGLVRGFTPGARRSLVAVGKAFVSLEPALDAVYRLEPNGQLKVWRGQDGLHRRGWSRAEEQPAG